MLISKVMELVPNQTAADNMANRVADKVRNMWQYHSNTGDVQWEENFFEDPDGIAFLRDEAFPYLNGIDYIMKWWGHDDIEGLAGQLEVLWKVLKDGEMKIYKTTIRLAELDFIRGNLPTEDKRREANRAEFRSAFATWQELYAENVGK